MRGHNHKAILNLGVFGLVPMLLALALPAPVGADGIPITVDVSPYVVNLENQGDAHAVRVFTNMPYSTPVKEDVEYSGSDWIFIVDKQGPGVRR